MRKILLFAGVMLCIGLLSYVVYSPESKENKAEAEEVKVTEPQLFFGIEQSDYNISSAIIQRNEFFANILKDYNVSYSKIHELAEAAKDVFDVRLLRSGKPYHIMSKDGCNEVSYFIYEPDDFRYILYKLDGEPEVEIFEHDVTLKKRLIEGEIQSSLWLSLSSQGLPASLISKMENAYAWSVDFYHLQKGDTYKLWYEEKYIDDKIVGTGSLIAGIMNHGDKDIYAIYYDAEEVTPGYYNLEGRPMQKAFLKAPVKYSRISSRFNRNRRHPILKSVRPHLGTDYAAPHGTPIYAVAAGTVTHASYTGGNGNYVKIKHDRTYSTQYLHMSKFAEGIKSGTYVDQGDVIGYVGSTGLATGPHVCFRFWKNGVQVDPLRLELPPPEPMDSASLQNYLVYRDRVLQVLDEDCGYVDFDPILHIEDSSS